MYTTHNTDGWRKMIDGTSAMISARLVTRPTLTRLFLHWSHPFRDLVWALLGGMLIGVVIKGCRDFAVEVGGR